MGTPAPRRAWPPAAGSWAHWRDRGAGAGCWGGSCGCLRGAVRGGMLAAPCQRIARPVRSRLPPCACLKRPQGVASRPSTACPGGQAGRCPGACWVAAGPGLSEAPRRRASCAPGPAATRRASGQCVTEPRNGGPQGGPGRRARSWLRKLRLAKAVLLGSPPHARADEDTLAHVYIYLQARPLRPARSQPPARRARALPGRARPPARYRRCRRAPWPPGAGFGPGQARASDPP